MDTEEALQAARRRLLRPLSKGTADGFVSAWLNRPISRRITERLAATPLTPDHVSFLAFLLCLGGAVLLMREEYVWVLAGGLLVQLASIVDGCDGELARLKHRASARGAWLDTMLDRYADSAVALAITYAFSQRHPGIWPWTAGMGALAGFLLAGYVTKEYAARFGRDYPDDVLNRLKRRDLRLLLIAVGAAVNRPFEALVTAGLLSHLCILGILVSGWRSASSRVRA